MSDRPQRWQALFADLTTQLEEIIRIAGGYPRDGYLADLRNRAEVALRVLKREAAAPALAQVWDGSLGRWGQNGHAPRIRMMLTDARLRADKLAAARDAAREAA